MGVKTSVSAILIVREKNRIVSYDLYHVSHDTYYHASKQGKTILAAPTFCWVNIQHVGAPFMIF